MAYQPEQQRPAPEALKQSPKPESGGGERLEVFRAELEAAHALPPIGEQVMKKAETHGIALSPEKQAALVEADKQFKDRLSAIALKGNEEAYLVNHKVVLELEERYNSPETSPSAVLAAVKAYAEKVGVPSDLPESFLGQEFSSGTMELVLADIASRTEMYFMNKETGRVNPKKRDSLLSQATRYAELIYQAQMENGIPSALKLVDVARMMRENVDKLAFQDRVAAENLLGDHGIRHLVDHNIVVSEKIFDQLASKGQEVKAIDRLMAHQIMIDHDIGYATSSVRDRINAEGIRGQDAGHNLLAAKFISLRMNDPSDHLNKLFGREALEQIHSGILEHDSSRLEFTVGDNSPEARRKNLESAIHLADNTHAFEDKLPELLYGVPETLKYMRLMKIAGETGDTAKVEEIKGKLAAFIEGNEAFSGDDKEALTMAIKGLSAESYKFSVPRICGNKPEFAIDENGKVEITVQESAVHREAMAVFDQASLKQLMKFIRDLGGPSDIGLDDVPIDTGTVTFKLAIGKEGSSNHNDYQERVAQLISEEPFKSLLQSDTELVEQSKALEASMAADPASEAMLTPQLDEIRQKRSSLLDAYLSA